MTTTCEHEYLDILRIVDKGLSAFFICKCFTCGELIETERN
jgi:hypothetical protein